MGGHHLTKQGCPAPPAHRHLNLPALGDLLALSAPCGVGASLQPGRSGMVPTGEGDKSQSPRSITSPQAVPSLEASSPCGDGV